MKPKDLEKLDVIDDLTIPPWGSGGFRALLTQKQVKSQKTLADFNAHRHMALASLTADQEQLIAGFRDGGQDTLAQSIQIIRVYEGHLKLMKMLTNEALARLRFAAREIGARPYPDHFN